MNSVLRTKQQPLPKVSIIIIDYKENNPYLVECLESIQKQSFKNYEIILVTDYKNNLIYPKLTKKHYGKYVGPAEKRDDGAKMAKGEVLAFIDDDAYPHKDWLKNLVKNFEDKNIVGVGGPGVTPSNVSILEEASGWASATPFGSGTYLYRFLPRKKRFVEDYPSMNLAVRRKEFLEVGGYDSNYWPGEDTKLCLDLVSKTNKKIIYDPKVLVYHHRRPVLQPHLRQSGNFGLHRGFFARVLPKTSQRLIYFLPSFFLIYLTLMLLLIIANFHISGTEAISAIKVIIYSPLAVYLLLLLINSLWIFSYSKKLTQSLLSIPVIFITHLWYGARFLQGLLFTDKLKQ
jgi:cellulose synthase/poly-beta-1,6-N-acetylglucosamine synthase-like glycosyltransferase